MSYEQGGAEGVATKKDLKSAALTRPGLLYLYSTSAVGDGGWSGYAATLPEGVTFNVVGPDPYRSRKWYASVTRKGDKVTVK